MELVLRLARNFSRFPNCIIQLPPLSDTGAQQAGVLHRFQSSIYGGGLVEGLTLHFETTVLPHPSPACQSAK